MSQYFQVLVCAGAVPFLLSLWPPLGLWRKWRSLALSLALILFIFGGWDILATFRGHWHFNPAAVSSITIINLPLEEALFFLVIPFCCIFTWEALLYINKRGK